MPIYDMECNKCGKSEETFVHVNRRDKQECSKCGGKMRVVLKKSTPPIFHEYYSENLGCQITGPRQKARILKEKGLAESA